MIKPQKTQNQLTEELIATFSNIKHRIHDLQSEQDDEDDYSTLTFTICTRYGETDFELGEPMHYLHGYEYHAISFGAETELPSILEEVLSIYSEWCSIHEKAFLKLLI